MLQVGETLAGYRVEEIVGIGGMAIVYRATQLSLDRAVALKVLSTTLVGNRSFRERFRLEGRHAAALDHPNIIPVYEAGESNGAMFIAMRLVDGPTLAELTTNGISGAETLRILAAIASALDAAHAAGLAHRDVKPQNILLTRAGHPYLADFGITKGPQDAALTRTGDFVGSLSCVAPEQIEGREVTPATDVYALAGVLFHCLTGTQPYRRDTDAALMHAHLHAPPPTFADVGLTVSPALDAVFRRGMAKDPADRHASAGALVAACDAALRAFDPQALSRTPALPPAAPGDIEPVGPQGARAAAADAAPAAITDAPAASETAIDRRQPTRVSERPDTRPAPLARAAWLRRALAAAAVPAALLLLAAGWAVGHGSATPHRAIRSQALSLVYGDGWAPARSSAAIAGLQLDDAVALRGIGGGLLVAGRLHAPAPGFDPAPAALRARVASGWSSSPVLWGRAAALVHGGRLRTGRLLWAALLPDTRGWVAVACELPSSGRTSACREVAATLRVRGASPVALGPTHATAAALASAVSALDAAVEAGRGGLRARSARVRARTAAAMAARETAAAERLRRLAAGPQERPLVHALAAAIAVQAHALRRLATAAAHRDAHAYNSARRDVGSSALAIDTALRGFSAAGYQVS